MHGRRAQLGTNTVVYSVLTIGVLVLINYLGVQHEWRYDATEEAIFSIAPQTQRLLDGLDEDVHVYGFFRENEEQRARELLESYAAASDRFAFSMVDPDKDPALTQEMEVTQYGTLVLTAGEEKTRINETSEQALTNALIRFTAGSQKRVYFATGHGEPELDPRETPADFGQLKASLENERYEVEELLLATVPDVPADADVLVVTGTDRRFLDHELEVLERYIDRGGSTLWMIDPRTGEELLPLLATRGIDVRNDIIIDQVMQLFSGPSLGVQPIVEDYGFHSITQDFSERTIYNLARSVQRTEETPEGVSASELARTSRSSWAESDVDRLFGENQAGFDEDDQAGPVPVAMAATLRGEALDWTPPRIETAPEVQDIDAVEEPEEGEGDTGEETGGEEGAVEGEGDAGEETGGEEGAAEGEGDPEETDSASGEAEDVAAPTNLEGRMVVVGDSDWVNNSNLSLYFNEDFFLNAVGWLAGEEELISIRPRATRASRVMLTEAESWAVFYSSVLLLPEIVLLAGLAIWWRRRR